MVYVKAVTKTTDTNDRKIRFKMYFFIVILNSSKELSQLNEKVLFEHRFIFQRDQLISQHILRLT